MSLPYTNQTVGSPRSISLIDGFSQGTVLLGLMQDTLVLLWTNRGRLTGVPTCIACSSLPPSHCQPVTQHTVQNCCVICKLNLNPGLELRFNFGQRGMVNSNKRSSWLSLRHGNPGIAVALTSSKMRVCLSFHLFRMTGRPLHLKHFKMINKCQILLIKWDYFNNSSRLSFHQLKTTVEFYLPSLSKFQSFF